jgi:hypothetical protein
MAENTQNSGPIRSGPEIVTDFIDSLKRDDRLDRATVEAIESLFKEQRFTLTNLLRSLEERRGPTRL